MFLLVPVHPGSPGQRAVKRSSSLLLLSSLEWTRVERRVAILSLALRHQYFTNLNANQQCVEITTGLSPSRDLAFSAPAFSAFTLLVWHQEEHLACKKTEL